MAAEAEFRDLVERIEAAGWTGEEAASSLLSLSLNWIQQRKATAEDEARISAARKARGN